MAVTTICIILGMINNQEMIQIILEDLCGIYANGVAILYKALEREQILVSEGDPVTSSPGILWDDCTLFPLPRMAGTDIPCLLHFDFLLFANTVFLQIEGLWQPYIKCLTCAIF